MGIDKRTKHIRIEKSLYYFIKKSAEVIGCDISQMASYYIEKGVPVALGIKRKRK